MRRRILPTLSQEENKPVKAHSPDGEWKARAAGDNTIAVYKQGRGWGTYRGHQDGIYHRTHATIQEITWESDTVVRSVSSTGSIHRWRVPQCIHVETIRPAQERRIA